MDYNILVNQRVANEWGLTLKQAYFFAYLYRLSTWSTKAKLVGDDQNPYHWVTQKKIIEDLPILNIKPESIRTYFKPLEDKGLIKKSTKQSPAGSMMYIQVTAMAKVQWGKDWREEEATRKNNTSHPQKNAGAHPQKFADNHSTINHDTNITPIVPKGDKEREFQESVKNIYNKHLGKYSKFQAINKDRSRRIKSIKKEYPGFRELEKWDQYFKSVLTSSIINYTGTNGTWKINFDWLVKDKNFVRMVEGQFHQHTN